MRSTVVMIAIDLDEHQFAWAHSGDSRAYLFRDGAQVSRTVDHSLVQQMVSDGVLDDEAARQHPQRNLLLSALGSVDEAPEITISTSLLLAVGDALLLCSDGVWEPLGDERLLELLREARNPKEWVEAIGQEVMATAKPGFDNYTAFALWTHADDEITEPLPL
jgi:serine/threonine protein phosphatase PrpC